jgi:cobalt-zinc-cadmium efflux system outer membrane protein
VGGKDEASADSTEPDGPSDEPSKSLSLNEAVALALERNPALAAAGWNFRAEEAGIVEARTWPNPEFEFEAEGFGGDGEMRGTDSLETTYAFSQVFELGGERSRRTNVASLNRDLAAWELERARLDTVAETRGRFVNLLAAVERVRVQRDIVSMASETLDAVRGQVVAGKASPVDETRARAELSRARIELGRLESARSIERVRLAAMWGSTDPAFDETTGDLSMISKPPAANEVADLLSSSPDLARRQTEIRSAEETVRLRKAAAVPDLAVGAGVKYENASDSTGFVAAVSIPIPVFNRNAGAIQAARSRAEQAVETARAARLELRVALEAACESARAAYRESMALRDEALPAAEEAHRAAEESYRVGKLGYLDVLSSRGSLARVRTEYIEALTTYHTAVIEIERLIGRPEPTSTQGEEQ